MAQDKVYSISPGSAGRLNVIDASTGMTLNTIMIDGDIVTGPIVVGDKCTLVASKNNVRRGYIYKLPSGMLYQSYSV